MKQILLFTCLILWHFTAFSQYSNDTLILFMPFSGDAQDISGFNNNGVVSGATLTEDRFGNPKSAYYFDGVDDVIVVKASESLNSISGFITLSAWVKPISQYYNQIISKGFQDIMMDLTLYLRPSVYYRGLDIDYTGVEFYWGRTVLYKKIPEDEWTFLASTYNYQDQEICIYINGQLVQKCHASGFIKPGTGDLSIGAQITDVDIWKAQFKGAIDELKIYTRRLLPEEIENIYYEQDPKCTNYVTVFDTVEVTNYVSVADTLIIDANFSKDSISNENLYIKVYPNPTNNKIIIDTGDPVSLYGYKVKLFNSLSQALLEFDIRQQYYQIDLWRIGAKGLYHLSFYNTKGNLIASKKVILE